MTTSKDLIDRLLRLFDPPKTADLKAVLDEYRIVIEKFDRAYLVEAGDILRDTHTFRSFPTVAEVKNALNTAASRHPVSRTTDWDSVEAERRKGWSLADLNQYRTAESIAYRNELVAQMKRNIAAMKVEDVEDEDIDWKRGQRDGFLEMQRNSPNKALHIRKVVK